MRVIREVRFPPMSGVAHVTAVTLRGRAANRGGNQRRDDSPQRSDHERRRSRRKYVEVDSAGDCRASNVAADRPRAQPIAFAVTLLRLHDQHLTRRLPVRRSRDCDVSRFRDVRGLYAELRAQRAFRNLKARWQARDRWVAAR